MTDGPSHPLFCNHSRHWQSNRFVYPVLSRRSRGLSLGINLNPDACCNFNCVYCSVDRSESSSDRHVDPEQIRVELQELLNEVLSGRFWTLSPFDRTPFSLRHLNDIAFSGNGEPTTCRQLPIVCKRVVEVLHELQIKDLKIVLITNATLLHRPDVIRVLEFLDQHHGQVWAKLDAGTESYYRTIHRTQIPFERILNNILNTGKHRPIVIQSMFIRWKGQDPSESEIDAYLQRLKWLNHYGCRIRLVQAYTVARPTACDTVQPVSSETLDSIVERIRRTGLDSEAYYADEDRRIDEGVQTSR